MKNLLHVSNKWKREERVTRQRSISNSQEEGRRYSWDIPPDEKGQNAKGHDKFGQESMGGRKFSWDKPPNLTDFNTGLMNLKYMGGNRVQVGFLQDSKSWGICEYGGLK